MPYLKTIEQNPSFAPKESAALPERLISGDPRFISWPQDADMDGRINTGVWQATPGVTHSIKADIYEFCYLLAGERRRTGDLCGGRHFRPETGLGRGLEDDRDDPQGLCHCHLSKHPFPSLSRSGPGRGSTAASYGNKTQCIMPKCRRSQ